MVHTTLQAPAEVYLSKHALHLDATPRTRRRKATREELSLAAGNLGKRLEELDEQCAAATARTKHLEKELANAHRNLLSEREKSASLEKQMRRVVAMLSDALRTGMFTDHFGHLSLLGRVAEDAPSALDYQSQSLLTPSVSERSQRSSAVSLGKETSMSRSNRTSPAAASGPDSSHDTSLQPPCNMDLGDHSIQDFTSNLRLDGHGMDPSWLDLFDEPGTNDMLPDP
jgi:hypothetical protein